MKRTFKIGIFFLALLLFFTSIRVFSSENVVPFNLKTERSATCFLAAPDSNQATFTENKTFQFNIFQKINVGFSKQLSESFANVAFHFWKFDKEYHYIRYPDTREYSLEISDIIYPFHYFF